MFRYTIENGLRDGKSVVVHLEYFQAVVRRVASLNRCSGTNIPGYLISEPDEQTIVFLALLFASVRAVTADEDELQRNREQAHNGEDDYGLGQCESSLTRQNCATSIHA